MAFGLA